MTTTTKQTTGKCREENALLAPTANSSSLGHRFCHGHRPGGFLVSRDYAQLEQVPVHIQTQTHKFTFWHTCIKHHGRPANYSSIWWWSSIKFTQWNNGISTVSRLFVPTGGRDWWPLFIQLDYALKTEADICSLNYSYISVIPRLALGVLVLCW